MISDVLQELFEMKAGNKEMAFFYDPESEDWECHFGNTSEFVMLGEASGEFITSGKSLLEAAVNMKFLLKGSA